MAHAARPEPVEDLLRQARESGFSVTRDQLHRWQQVGLLPAPRQRGLGPLRGTDVLYPPGSARQLVAICRHRGEKRRSLKHIAWALWWDGFPLTGQAKVWIGDLFHEEVAYLEKLAAREFKGGLDLLDVLDEAPRARLSHPVAGRARRRTGRVSFSTFLKLTLETITGTYPEFDDEADAKIVAKGLGFANPKDAEPALRSNVSVLEPWRLREVLDSTSMENLAQARDEMRAVLRWVDGVNLLAAAAMGRDLDPRLLAALSQPSHREGPHLVLAWLSMMNLPGARGIYETVTSTLRDVARGVLSPTKALEVEFDANHEE